MIGLMSLWPSGIDGSPHLSTHQYAQIVRDWVMSLDVEPSSYGMHSIRRIKEAEVYKAIGHLWAAQLLPGHTRTDRRVGYPRVNTEEALTNSEGST